MNKFLTFAGTQPVYLGDIDFMQSAAANAFKQLAKALMDSGSDSLNAILQGVELQWNSSTLTITPGVVVLNGELLPFEGVTLEAPVSLYFHLESTLSGERTFKDGESHKCHETRKAIVNTTSTDGISLYDVPRLHKSDDRTYNGSIIAGSIATSAKLTYKNGFYFLQLDMVVPASSQGVEVQFTGLPSEEFANVDGLTFPAPVVLKESSSLEIQNFICEIVVYSPGTIRFNIEFAGAQVATGSGQCSVMVPII